MKIFRTLSAARRELPRVIPLYRDSRVPLWAKIAAIAVALVVVSPLNIFGDIPLLGFFDDAALLAFVVHFFVRFAEGRIANAYVPPVVKTVGPRDAGSARATVLAQH